MRIDKHQEPAAATFRPPSSGKTPSPSLAFLLHSVNIAAKCRSSSPTSTSDAGRELFEVASALIGEALSRRPYEPLTA